MCHLWLDDERRAPRGWTHVKTAQACIDHLRGGVETLSLDHDLGDAPDAGTGMDVVKFLEENPHLLPDVWQVHSMNVVAAPQMRARLEQVAIMKANTNGNS